MEKGASLYTTFSVGRQEVKFRKEPDFGKDTVLRRALKVGPDANDFMGFAVDFTRHKLYLDLNQNLDLSDDPEGLHEGSGGRESASFGLRLHLSKNGIGRAYLLAMYFPDRTSGSFSVRSAYRGEIELQGRKWLLEVQDNLDGEINRQDQMSIRPVSSRTDERGSASYGAVPAAQKLVLNGRQYQVTFTFSSGADISPLTARFTEISSPLGELILDGQFIQHLVLDGDEGLAILDSPSQQILLPVGKYRVQSVYVQPLPAETQFSGQVSGMPRFSITPVTPYHLKIGGPLESSATASAGGSLLNLGYVLKGAGGEQYAITSRDYRNPPKFVIYRGDRQLAAGSFQFG